MAAEKYTVQQRAEVVALRDAGISFAIISEQTGVGIETVKKILGYRDIIRNVDQASINNMQEASLAYKNSQINLNKERAQSVRIVNERLSGNLVEWRPSVKIIAQAIKSGIGKLIDDYLPLINKAGYSDKTAHKLIKILKKHAHDRLGELFNEISQDIEQRAVESKNEN